MLVVYAFYLRFLPNLSENRSVTLCSRSGPSTSWVPPLAAAATETSSNSDWRFRVLTQDIITPSGVFIVHRNQQKNRLCGKKIRQRRNKYHLIQKFPKNKKMYLVTSCLLRKKNYIPFERIKCFMYLVSHKSNDISELGGFVKFFHFIWSKIDL